MKLKEGVKVGGIRTETLIAMIIADETVQAFDIDFVVTSVTDGKHMNGSKHYSGLAFDMRTRDMCDTDIMVLKATLKQNLGKDYDVIYENDHMHIEYDPK